MSESPLTRFRAPGAALALLACGTLPQASAATTDPIGGTLQEPSASSLPFVNWKDTLRTDGRIAARSRFEAPLVQAQNEGELWVRGATYKAGFRETGTTFVPYFGAQASASHPVTFRVVEFSVGGAPFAFDAEAPPRAYSTTLEYARGSFRERYECRTAGIEQLFVFEELPTRGEVRLSVSVESDLAARTVEAGFVFESDLGHVAYGRAIAIDADGRRADVASQFVNGSIELVVPADFVATARLPLVIDPLISTFAIASTPAEDFDPDVAYDAATGHWMVTYEETFSATDHDVWAEIRDASGAFVAGNYADVTTDYWAHPRIAGNGLAQAFLVVAAVGQPTGGARVVRGRMATASNAVFGSAFTISGAETGEQINPDVGGDPGLAGPTYFCVVWERVVDGTNHDVFARLVQSDGNLFGAGTFLLDASLATLDSVPAISKSNGGAPSATQDWTIAWHRATGFPDFGDILGAQIHWDGTLTHATFPINATEEDVYDPEVSSPLDAATGVRSTLVVYSSFDSYFATGLNVVASIVNGASVVGTADLHAQINLATISLDQKQPSVDSDGQHFAVTYAQRSATGTSNDDVLFADVLISGSSPRVCESGVVAGTLDREFRARIASAHGGGGAAQRYMLVWDKTDIAGGGLADVHGGLYDGGLGGCVRAQCFGDGSGLNCPCSNLGAIGNGCASSVSANGGNLSWSGNPRVSADTFVLIGTSMPNSSCLYFQGTTIIAGGSGSAFGDGLRCAGGSVTRLGTKINSGGASQYPVGPDQTVSVRCAIPASGQVRWYQIWYRNAAPFCTSSTFNLTNALNVVWAP